MSEIPIPSDDHEKLTLIVGKQFSHSLILPSGGPRIARCNSEKRLVELHIPENNPDLNSKEKYPNQSSEDLGEFDSDWCDEQMTHDIGEDINSIDEINQNNSNRLPSVVRSFTKEIDSRLHKDLHDESQILKSKLYHPLRKKNSIWRTILDSQKAVDPNLYESFSKLRFEFLTCVAQVVKVNESESDLENLDPEILLSSFLPHVIVGIDGEPIYRTRVVPFTRPLDSITMADSEISETWNEMLEVFLYHNSSRISIEFFDLDVEPLKISESSKTTEYSKKKKQKPILIGQTSFSIKQFKPNQRYTLVVTAHCIMPQSSSLLHYKSQSVTTLEPGKETNRFSLRKRQPSNSSSSKIKWSPLELPAYELVLKLEIGLTFLPNHSHHLLASVAAASLQPPQTKVVLPPTNWLLTLKIASQLWNDAHAFLEFHTLSFRNLVLWERPTDSFAALSLIWYFWWRRCLFLASFLVVLLTLVLTIPSLTEMDSNPIQNLDTTDQDEISIFDFTRQCSKISNTSPSCLHTQISVAGEMTPVSFACGIPVFLTSNNFEIMEEIDTKKFVEESDVKLIQSLLELIGNEFRKKMENFQVALFRLLKNVSMLNLPKNKNRDSLAKAVDIILGKSSQEDTPGTTFQKAARNISYCLSFFITIGMILCAWTSTLPQWHKYLFVALGEIF
eukprot:GHVP01058125.1.p1 GENE.GHVP01058125.1~~GHVP01058125.1.p1  ORF type:complete len:674 (+),score=124.01 GHVP01058125.1:20-2041(+)